MKKISEKFGIRTHNIPEVSELIQKILFREGYGWGTEHIKELRFVDSTHALYFGKSKTITYTPYVNPSFSDCVFITIDEFITNNFTFPEKIPISKDYVGTIVNGTSPGLNVGCQFIPKANLEVLFEKLKALGILS